MFGIDTKCENQYSHTHSLDWDIPYSYSTSVQARLDGPQVHGVISKALPFFITPILGTMPPRPI